MKINIKKITLLFIDIICLLYALVSAFAVGLVIIDYFAQKKEFTRFSIGDYKQLSIYEKTALFPTLEKDWEYIQSLVNTKNLRSPKIYYQTNDNHNDLVSNGTYYWDMNIINIDRDVFATSTESYKRYVLLHEMYHMASFLTNDYPLEMDNHCYMVNNLIFSKIGDYIGDSQLGDSKQIEYSKLCNKNNNEK